MTEQEATTFASGPLGRLIVGAIRRAYQARQRTHRPADGDNATTFGSNVRFSIEKFIEDGIGRVPSAIVTRPLGAYRLSHRDRHFHFYKYGSMGQNSIDDFRFDDSFTKIALVEDPQLDLPNFVARRNYVFAHSGSSEFGIRDIYLGAANSLGGRFGSPWAWRHLVFRTESPSEPDRLTGKIDQEELFNNVIVKRKLIETGSARGGTPV